MVLETGWTRLRRELGSVFALLLAAGGLFAFLRLASEVREGDTRAFDTAILLALRNPADSADPVGPLWLEIAMRDITSLGSTAVLALVTALAVGYLVIDRKRHAALLLVAAAGGGALLSAVIKGMVDRPRPELVAHLVDVHDMSFPSGHSMLSATIYLTIGVLLARTSDQRRIKVYIVGCAVGMTLLIGLSRLYLGVHWPTDVLAGWSLGSAWAMLCWLVARWLQRRGDVETPAGEPAGAPAS
jgi:undecaprenyl-diphosphatase